MLTLNAVMQTQMMLNTQVTQIQQLSWKTLKNSKLILADRKLKLREIAEELKISEGNVFTIFAWTFVNEKTVLKVGATFSHSQLKTTTHRWFRVLFVTVSMQQKGVFCINLWQWMKYGSTTSFWSQISCQLRGQQQVKTVQSNPRCKPQ